MRHAIAAARGEPEFDGARPLLPKGRKRFEAVIERMHAAGVRLDAVYHSPLTRAVQTAEYLEDLSVGDAAPRHEADFLLTSPQDFDFSRLPIEGERVALVGHEPFLSELLAFLVTGDAALGHHFPFKKGGFAWLQGEPTAGGAVLKTLVAPKWLR